MMHSIRFLAVVLLLVNCVEAELTSFLLTERQKYDLELLLNGGFAPLTGFMNYPDYINVVKNMRLDDGSLWPMPITFDVTEEQACQLQNVSEVTLKGLDGTSFATLHIEDIYKPDKEFEAAHVYGTTGDDHPAVAYLYHEMKEYYVGGRVTPLQPIVHYNCNELRATPAEVKQLLKDVDRVVAFQTRNPMHRAHFELTKRAAEQNHAHLLLHPVVGPTKPGDIDYITRVHCYKHILQQYPEGTATLRVLPLAMRMAGPREALWHALIRKNYGATHFIVGRDHAGPGPDKNGENFYGLYDAQELVRKYADEIGITMVPFQEMVYLENEDRYCPRDEVPEGAKLLTISGTQLRKALVDGTNIPTWFTFPEVIKELRKNYPPKIKQGVTIFFTGFSGAGKSTIARALHARLLEVQERKITVLDGDIVRQNLSKGLGFSKEDRSINVRRVGFVANEVVKHGGLAICSLIAPYEEDRSFNRKLIQAHGNYIEVYVSTPLSVCAERDPKGLYAAAMKRSISNFTGISDPYEPPQKPEITIDTSQTSIEYEVQQIINYLDLNGYI